MLCSRLLKVAGFHRDKNSDTPQEEAFEVSKNDPALPGEQAKDGEANEKSSGWWNWTESAYERLAGGYKWTLELALKHRPLVVFVSVALFIVTILLFYIIPKGFIPSDDTSQIIGYTEAAEGTSFEEMSRHQEQAVDVIRANPNGVG